MKALGLAVSGSLLLAVAVAVGASGNAAKDRFSAKALKMNSPRLKLASLPPLLRLPMIRQATDYTCGVAALQSVLAFFGDDFDERELMSALGPDPEFGTDYRRIASLAQSLGYEVQARTGMGLVDLEALLHGGRPVIVALQAWIEVPAQTDWPATWDSGHYAVAIGYDERHVYFMDPAVSGNYVFIPRAEFLLRWHDLDGRAQEKVEGLGIALKKGEPKFVHDDVLLME